MTILMLIEVWMEMKEVNGGEIEFGDKKNKTCLWIDIEEGIWKNQRCV